MGQEQSSLATCEGMNEGAAADAVAKANCAAACNIEGFEIGQCKMVDGKPACVCSIPKTDSK